MILNNENTEMKIDFLEFEEPLFDEEEMWEAYERWEQQFVENPDFGADEGDLED